MLVLSRKVSQQIQIGSDILITVVRIDRNQVRIGISAPDGVTILREELLNSRQAWDDDEIPVARHPKPAHQFCTLEMTS